MNAIRKLSGEHWGDLAPFLPPRSVLRMTTVGVTSFLGGLAESSVLVLVTLTADSLIRGSTKIEVLGATTGRSTAVGAALVLVAVRVAMTLLSASTSARFAAGVMARAQAQVLVAYLRSSHVARSARPAGDLTAVTINHGRMTGDLASAYAMVATSLCGLVAFGGTSLVVNPVATLAIAAIGSVLLLLMRPLRRASQASAKAFAEVARTIGRDATEIEQLHREIELFQVAGPVLERAETEIDAGAERFRRLRFMNAAIPQLFQAALLGAAVLSLLLVVNSEVGSDLAAVGAVVLLLIRSMSAAQQLVNANQRVVEFGSSARSLRRLVEELRSTATRFGSARPASLTPLALDHVTFSYDGATPVLHDLDLRLDDGELVGIVGPSGAGKSTFVELLLRLRPPTTGSITCGGVRIEEVDPAEFARRVAFVPQQAVLIGGTVAENVDLFRGLPEDRIRLALKRAHLEEEVDALPQGIHTRLGPDDRSLSGGQQQRLTIARALAGDPDVLVLDEPTSALDAVSEEAIRRTLTELPEGRVVVIVAHRYSTLRSCNRILVLRDGRLEADATPEEVAARSDFFKAMVAEGS